MKLSINHIIITLFLSCTALSFCLNIFAQGNSLAASHVAYRNTAEKLYVHTDKDVYVAGEIIWFKTYCINAWSGLPSSLSKIGYVEVLDAANKPLFQAKVALQLGSGNGSFMIPASVKSANYTVRAYTNWMKNFSSSFIFQKKLQILNASKRPEWQSIEKQPAYDIQFFPEGGELVSGLESRVAFRVADQQGRGSVFQGFVLDSRQDTMARFSPLHAGIGSFQFRPTANQEYRAIVKLPDGLVIQASLPAVKSTGYVSTFKKVDDKHLSMTVNHADRSASTTVFLGIQSGSVVHPMRKAEMINGSCKFLVELDELAQGTSTFTFYDSNEQPVVERLYFKKPLPAAQLNLKLNDIEFGQRSLVAMELSFADSVKKPARTDLSISVFLRDSLQGIKPDEMPAYLLLSAHLRGKIESPEYYLRNQQPDAETEIDNLMLSHGWRKISPLKSSRLDELDYLPEYEGQLIVGQVSERGSGRAVPATLAYLSVPGERYHLSNTVSDKNGKLVFVLDNNYGTTQVVAQTNSVTDSNYVITISDPYQVNDMVVQHQSFQLAEASAPALLAHSISAQVQNSFEGEKRLQFSYPLDMDSTPFYGLPDKMFFLDDYTRFPTMEEVFREFIADVYLRKRSDGYSMNVRNIPNSVVFREEPLVLIDGLPVFNLDKLIALDPLKIKKIEVVNKTLYHGFLNNQGIVSCSSYEGDLAGYELDRNATVLQFPGITFKREFFSPVYDNAERLSSPVADARNLLYWNPDVIVGEQPATHLKFYTSDIPGNYAVVVQGIGSDGSIHSLLKEFIVK